MRVTQGMIANNVTYNLQQSLYRLERLSNQLSTGKAFHRPSQDPVGNYKTMRYNSVINYNDRYRKNMDEARGFLETTEIAMLDGLLMMQRMRELAVYAANDPLTFQERLAIAHEVKEYYEAFVGMGNKEYNGVFIFGGYQTLDKPFIDENLYRVDIPENMLADLDDGEDEAIDVDGLRHGSYELTARRETGGDEASLVATQEFLQGSALSIFGKGECNLADPFENVNASIMMEIADIEEMEDNVTRVTYRYESHEYKIVGDEWVYGKEEGEFSLDFGSHIDPQVKEIGSVPVMFFVSGLDYYDGKEVADIRVGDQALFNLQAAHQPGAEAVEVTGNFREGSASLTYYFDPIPDPDPGEPDILFLSDNDFTLHFHTLNDFRRSPDYGRVYDGSIGVTFADFDEFDPAGETLSFSYDPDGFAVYQGDEGERRQEISMYQQITTNIDGKKAFGENGEIFDAVKSIYWALMDDDRDTLGGDALAKLDDSVEIMLKRVAEVGARLERVESMDSTLFEENIFLREMRAYVQDIDIAEKLMDYSRQEYVYQAALATTARMMQPTLVDFLR